MVKRTYFVCVNQYRSSTDSGFRNTWRVYRCLDRAQQRKILSDGLPVADCQLLDNAGNRHPCYSSMGVRPATASDRTEARRLMSWYGRDAVNLIGVD